MKQKNLYFFFFVLFYTQTFDGIAINNTKNLTKVDITIATLKKDIETCPSPALYHTLGNIYGRTKWAETIYVDPSDLKGYQRQAIKSGIKTFQEGINAFPNASELYCGLGKLQFEINQDPDKAIEILQKGIEICPSATLYCALVDVYRYGLHNTELAIKTCKIGLKSYDNLNLYLALGEHSSFISRSRMNHHQKIKHKKEALKAYQNALRFNQSDTIYKNAITLTLTLYCELLDIYYIRLPDASNEISKFQHEAINYFEIAEQLPNCIINEKLRNTIQNIYDVLKETDETIYKDEKIILEIHENKPDDNNVGITFEEIVNKSEINHTHISTFDEEHPLTENIIWGDSLEPDDSLTSIEHEKNIIPKYSITIPVNTSENFLSDIETANIHFCELINDFKKNANHSEIRKKITPKIQTCENYLQTNNLKKFYYKIIKIYYSHLAQNEKDPHIQIKLLEKAITYSKHTLLNNDFVLKEKIKEIMPYYYYVIGNLYNFDLAKNEQDHFIKISYILKGLESYKQASQFPNFEFAQKNKQSITKLYCRLGNIYNLSLARKEKNIHIQQDYFKKALQAYEKAIEFSNPSTFKKIKVSIRVVQNALNNEL